RVVLARGDRGQPVEERHRHRGRPVPAGRGPRRAPGRPAPGRAGRMSTAEPAAGGAAPAAPSPAPRRRARRGAGRAAAWLPGLLLVSPSIVLIAVFVYGMIGWNTALALSDKHAPIDE